MQLLRVRMMMMMVVMMVMSGEDDDGENKFNLTKSSWWSLK